MAKFCKKCGSKLDEVSGKCPNCDKVAEEKNTSSDNVPEQQKQLSKKEMKAEKKKSKKQAKKDKKKKHICLRIITFLLCFVLFVSCVSGVFVYFNIVDIPCVYKLMDMVGITDDEVSYVGQSSESCYYPNEDNIVYENEEKSFGYVNNMLLVFFSNKATETQIAEIVSGIEGEVVGKIDGINQYQIQIEATTKENLEKICEALLKFDVVKNAIIDYVITTSINENPNDPWKDTFQGVLGVDWNENEPSGTNWWFEATKISSAWENSDCFSNIKVGIVDNGYDTAHEDLNITVLNNDVNNYENHGTHVAGVIGATVNNNKGISGILKDVSLYGVDCYSTSKQKKKNITVSSLYEGINLCIQNDCKVINMSSGIEYTDKDETKKVSYEMAKYAANCIVYLLDSYNKDFLIVQSAGNGDDWGNGVSAKDYNGWFSAIDEALVQELFDEYKEKGVKTEHQISVQDVMDSFMVVAAVDEKQKKGEYQLSSFSNYGDTVTVCAPGVNVFSTIKSGGLNGSYGYMDGTSMAAPIVSGITALVWSIDQEMASGEVKQIITETATEKVLSRRKNDNGTYFMIDAKAAVEKAVEKMNIKSEQSPNKGQFDNSKPLDGAVSFNGHYYMLYENSFNWEEAKTYCESLGGHLVCITSQEEQYFIDELLEGSTKNCYWIGGYLENSNWKWLTDEDFVFDNWAEIEPNNENGNENRIHLFGKERTDGTGVKNIGNWNDCSFVGAEYSDDFYELQNFGFICEWDEYTLESAEKEESSQPKRETSDKRDIVLVLDVSGSMSGTPLEETKKAATKFISTILKEDASIGIVVYDDNAEVLSDFSMDEEKLTGIVSGITDRGSTNIDDGLTKANELLQYSNAEKKIIVLMSDGMPNCGREGDDLIAFADSIKDTGTYIYTLGFFESVGGSKSSAQLLMEGIASDGCHYEVADADDLVFFFGDIADQINGQKFIYVRIACPVDVTVTYLGESLSSSEKDFNDRTSFGALSLEDIEDSDDKIKTLRLKEGKDYAIKINGTGRGKMDYTIGYMDDSGEYSDMRNFRNIDITRSTVIDTSTKYSDKTILNVDEDGDGKYDLKFRAGANEYGELVDYTYVIYIALGVVGAITVLIAVLVIQKKIKKRKAA